MGEIIKAICGCGYQSKELKFGAGMEDFEHSRTVPAISMTTAEIVELDILAKSPNPQLVPYTSWSHKLKQKPALGVTFYCYTKC